MTTLLDDAEPDYQFWFAKWATLSDNVFTVQLDRLVRQSEKPNLNVLVSYTVIFRDVQYLEVFGETRAGDSFFSSRDAGVLARHHASELLDRRKEKEFALSPRDYAHYSLMTTDEFFSVLTSYEPEIVRNDG